MSGLEVITKQLENKMKDCFHGRYKMNNKAICRKTDEHFTEGKEYECTPAYARYESAVVDIFDNNKELITVEINDEDFQFIFN